MPITRRTLLAGAAAMTIAPAVEASKKDTYLYELRVYHCHPGRAAALHTRFQKRTIGIFKRCGMEVMGFWDVNGKENDVVYMVRHKNRDAREKAWKAFGKDPEWTLAVKESEEKDGPIVAKADTYLFNATDFSPAVKTGQKGDARLYELRTYTSSPGNLERLVQRFRGGTVKLFEKHGMENSVYGTLDADQPAAKETLIYLLVHKSEAARNESFKNFGSDPDWRAHLAKSEQDAGGPLTAPGGVKSELLKPTSYSPMR